MKKIICKLKPVFYLIGIIILWAILQYTFNAMYPIRGTTEIASPEAPLIQIVIDGIIITLLLILLITNKEE